MGCNPQLPIDTPEAEATRRARLAYPPEHRLADARAAYLAGDWDALETALDISVGPTAGQYVPVREIATQPTEETHER